MYENAKYKKEFNESTFVNLYDKIGALYICTKEIGDLWDELANKVGINIAIFNGDNLAIKKIDESKFIEGVNILFGCMTNQHANTLNTKYNEHRKYFIGIDGYKHNYGSSIYACGGKPLSITREEFIREYERYGKVYPIIKIIKIFFSKFKYCEDINDKSCRNCNVITLDKIEEKLRKVKLKIDNNQKFNKNEDDHYFNTYYQHKCNEDEDKVKVKCIEDMGFEKYIKLK
jgi:hypothetical protein